MMRSSNPIGTCLHALELTRAASTALKSQLPQRRFKTFIRRVDKDDQIYYTLAKKGPLHTPPNPENIEFFEMPDLLLDLDAEGNPNVRVSEGVDEDRMLGRWGRLPKRVEVKGVLREFEDQVNESREKFHGIVSNSTNVWRLTSHDVLSAALYGAPGETQQEHFTENVSTSSHPSGAQKLSHQGSLVETLRRENGIPSLANEDDALLLEWMMLRRTGLDHAKGRRREQPPSPEKLGKALREHDTVTGVRRLVFRSLTSGASDPSYVPQLGFGKEPGQPLTVPREIRDAIQRTLKKDPGVRPASLGFLGNLAERLSKSEFSIGPTLCALALRLSAEEGLPEITAEWLHRGYVNGLWDRGIDASEDVLETFKAFQLAVELGRPDRFTISDQRRALLQLLTGINENHAIAPESLRALALQCMQSGSTAAAQLAFSIYESYIMLLGNLGAVRTLWKEGQISASLAESILQTHNLPGSVGALFHRASITALGVAANPFALGEAETSVDLSLDECVALDYHSIAYQDASSWSRDDVDGSGGNLDTATSANNSFNNQTVPVTDVSPALNLPLNEWLRKFSELLELQRGDSST